MKSKTPKKKTNRINLENEIVIGLTPKKSEAKSSNKNHSKKKVQTKKKKKKSVKKKVQKPSVSRVKVQSIFKWVSIPILATIAIILFMMSAIFNIREIQILGNDRISSEEIIRLSDVAIGQNMFRPNTWRMRRNISAEAYIGNVTIRRGLGGTLSIYVEERNPAFMLYLNGIYGYIDNQGYILEISEELLELPIITGFETRISGMETGNRLIETDLMKLGVVISIMNTARVYDIANIISNIDISDDQNYILEIRSEGLTVHFGNGSRTNQKILLIIACIEDTVGVYGELFLNEIDQNRLPMFRERVIF